jgi:excisionase family DNA binding protein|tara:strand:+ start:2311 stop:2604 length:294 start_codon:yes stop_codon:yes gene_type:complete
MNSNLQEREGLGRLVSTLEEIATQLQRLSESRTERDSPYMDPTEAARYLSLEDPEGKGRKLIMELGRQGKIPRSKVGKLVRYHKGDLDDWMRKGGTQ